jgi:hypothetical protein
VRAWPSASAQKVARLESGTHVWAIGETQVAGVPWYRVARDGVELGFVYGPLLVAIARNDQPNAADVGRTRGDSAAREEAESSVDERFSTLLDGMIEQSEEPEKSDD